MPPIEPEFDESKIFLKMEREELERKNSKAEIVENYNEWAIKICNYDTLCRLIIA
jgi:hypothetical protein